ncbi:hypothetical protein [Brevundimonas sp. Leaf363]|uniref:hypothetical protein n=1 Tax=Brevundimonas sp. Leaf363 TaxID=1736353 RepID=UPI0012E12A9E|nr:hypothetical protein [Brevundimonas sp. Leaf363]
MSAAPRSRQVMLGLVAGTVISLLLLPLALMWAAFSVMASDAGMTPAIETFITLSFCIPLAFVVGPILAWAAWFLRRYTLAVAALFLPLIPFVAAIVVMANA